MRERRESEREGRGKDGMITISARTPMVVGWQCLPGFLPGGDRVGVQPLGQSGVPGCPDTDHCLGYASVCVCVCVVCARACVCASECVYVCACMRVCVSIFSL